MDYRETDLGLLVTTGHDSAWTNKGTVYYLNLLDISTGSFRFPKSIKVTGRILSTEILPGGVLYVTTHEVGLFDRSSGASLLGQAVQSESLVTADAADVLYAFAPDDGALWRIDKQEAKATRLTSERIVLDGDDVARSLEVTGDRVALLGSQHVVGFDLAGIRGGRLQAALRGPQRRDDIRAFPIFYR